LLLQSIFMRYLMIFLVALLISSAAHSEPSTDLSRFSWHDYEGADWMSPVRDQGACGGCWAFAAAAVMEAMFNIELGDPDLDIDLSEQVLISCGLGSCDGWSAESALIYAANNGVPDEACYPYIAADGNCADRCAGWEIRGYLLDSWGWELDYSDRVMAIKRRLVSGPVASSMAVTDAIHAYSGGVYRMEGEEIGMHVVAIVGWDDGHNSWICKNSWGEDWGVEGYVEVDRDDATLLGADVVWIDVDTDLLPPDEELWPDDEAEPEYDEGCSCSLVS